MTQTDKAHAFAALHRKGAPLVLYNIWDAGGAAALESAGAEAIATGSWSMAAAHGYQDGEMIPLEFVLHIVRRICAVVAAPVSVDFEGGYATDTDGITANVQQLIRAGAVGLNFEDQVVGGKGLYPLEEQVLRIKAVRAAARMEDMPLFINARTDLFLGGAPAGHAALVHQAIDRAAAYAKAGADGFFVPGLTDPALIARIVERTHLPVNVMGMDGVTSIADLAAVGVSRVSHGPAPYRDAIEDLTQRFAHLS